MFKKNSYNSKKEKNFEQGFHNSEVSERVKFDDVKLIHLRSAYIYPYRIQKSFSLNNINPCPMQERKRAVIF